METAKKMNIVKNSWGEYEIKNWEAEAYVETRDAEPTSRVLNGSRDYGYDQEYKGCGHIGQLPIIAVYLLDEANYNSDEDGNPDEDAGNWDWETALAQGRMIVDVDKMPDNIETISQMIALSQQREKN